LLDGNIKEGIEEFVNEIEVDLICLSIPIRHFWAHLLKPNMTKDIVLKVNIPVLV
jgi:hypothetical protein